MYFVVLLIVSSLSVHIFILVFYFMDIFFYFVFICVFFICVAIFFLSSRRRHTRCALLTGVQTCALPISRLFLPVRDLLVTQTLWCQESAGRGPNHVRPLFLPGRYVGKIALETLVCRNGNDLQIARLVVLREARATADAHVGMLTEQSSNCLSAAVKDGGTDLGNVRTDRFGKDGHRNMPLIAGCDRSEEHTSELQSLMRISYAVFCLKKKK